jgi:hypothetical protein
MDSRDRHFQPKPKLPEYFEVVKRTLIHRDQRDGDTYSEQIVSVHTSREAAMASVMPKDIIVRPLTVKS